MSYQQFDLHSVNAQIRLTEFVTELETALMGRPEPWARTFGKSRQSMALRTRWPIPLSSAGYKEFLGDPRYRTLAHAFVELIPKIWQDGVAELKRVVEAPDFHGWGDEPQNMAIAAAALPNRIIAELLAGGEAIDCWDEMFFFDTGHPINPFKTELGTYDNLAASKPVDVTTLGEAKAAFRAMKSASGESLGLRMTHWMVPAALEEAARDALEKDLILDATGVAAERNRHYKTVDLIVADELEEDNYTYPLALNQSMRAWVVQDQGTVITKILGEDSALFEREKKVGVDSELGGNGALLMPQCILRWKTEA